MKTCNLCNKEYEGYGNNGMPLVDGLVCDDCNRKVVMARFARFTSAIEGGK